MIQQAVLLEALPYEILQKQKCYMHRHMSKLHGMKVHTYATHLTKINCEELPKLPLFKGKTQSLDKDKMVEIILYGVPNGWQCEMDRLNFNPETNTQQELIQFCERMESAEDRPNSGNNQRNNGQNGS